MSPVGWTRHRQCCTHAGGRKGSKGEVGGIMGIDLGAGTVAEISKIVGAAKEYIGFYFTFSNHFTEPFFYSSMEALWAYMVPHFMLLLSIYVLYSNETYIIISCIMSCGNKTWFCVVLNQDNKPLACCMHGILACSEAYEFGQLGTGLSWCR